MRSGNYMKMLGVLTGVMILFAGCGIESANTHMGTSKKVEAETVDESDQTVVKKKNYTAIKQENCPDNIFSRGQEIIEKIKKDDFGDEPVNLYSGQENIIPYDSGVITIYKEKDIRYVTFDLSGGMHQLTGGEMYSLDGGNIWYIGVFYKTCGIGDMRIINGAFLEVQAIGMRDVAQASISYDNGKTYTSFEPGDAGLIPMLPELRNFCYPKVRFIDNVNDRIVFEWYLLNSAIPYYETEVSISTFEIQKTKDLYDLSQTAAEYRDTGTIFKDSNTSFLDETEVRERYLNEYTISQDPRGIVSGIRYAINEIYARKHYDFTGTDYENYFNDKSWYSPIPGKIVAEEELNSYEKQNINLLVKIEKEYEALVID